MNILVIGGMHGNEPLGPQIVKLFRANPAGGVDTALANEAAIKANQRYINNDLNRSFPGDRSSSDYEIARAAELLDLTKTYDLVLDFHNTHCPNNDCGFVGETASQQLYDASAWLGLSRIIVADYDCINKYAPNCLSVEISLNSKKMDAQNWYERISNLAITDKLPAAEVEKYRFVYRMTLEDSKRLNLAAQNLQAFKAIEEDTAKAMQVKPPAFPIFVNDAYTPYNYGGLLNRLS